MNRIGAMRSGAVCRKDVEPGTKRARNPTAAPTAAALAATSKRMRASFAPREESDQPRSRRARIHAVGLMIGTGSLAARPRAPRRRYMATARPGKHSRVDPPESNGFTSLTADAHVVFFSTSTIEESLTDDVRYDPRHWDIWTVEER